MVELNELQKQVIAELTAKKEELQKRKSELETKKSEVKVLSINEHSELENINNLLAELEQRIAKASEPVNRTPEEIEQINKICDKVSQNIEISSTSVEGATAGKDLTGKQSLTAYLDEYVAQLRERHVKVVYDIKVQNAITEFCKQNKLKFAGKDRNLEEAYREAEERFSDILANMKVAEKTIEKRIEQVEEQKPTPIDWMLENYDNLVELNFFLNNPLKLDVFVEQITNIQKEIE